MFFGKQQENKVRKHSIDIILTDFDEVLWIFIIDKVVIEDDNNIIFHLKDRTKIKQEII